MTDPHLARCVRQHYEARAFSPALVERLCVEIGRRGGERGVEIAKGWWVSPGRLREVFEPIAQSTQPAVLHPAPSAILALSFGYRFDSPFARFPEDRKPGPNNASLAAMTERCHELFPEAWIAVQHEVGLALDASGTLEPELVSPARDWNTAQVPSFFIDHLPRITFASNRRVIVVSHLHHSGRCALLLERAGLESFPPPKEVMAYADYDAAEAQPRFRSPWEYLVNDFLAICKIATETRTFADSNAPETPLP